MLEFMLKPLGSLVDRPPLANSSLCGLFEPNPEAVITDDEVDRSCHLRRVVLGQESRVEVLHRLSDPSLSHAHRGQSGGCTLEGRVSEGFEDGCVDQHGCRAEDLEYLGSRNLLVEHDGDSQGVGQLHHG